MSKIYAVIVTYNAERWIEGCLESLKNSTSPVEPIIVDNASTDNSVNLIRKVDPSIQVFKLEKNIGFGNANNIGIRFAVKENCDYVLLLNQDARIEPNTVAALVRTFEQAPDYGILSPIHLAEDYKLDKGFEFHVSRHAPAVLSDLLSKKKKTEKVYETGFVNAAIWLLSRKCIEIVGGFDPLFFMYGEDDDYVERVKYHGLKIGICPDIFAYHLRVQKSDTGSSHPLPYKDYLKHKVISKIKSSESDTRTTYWKTVKTLALTAMWQLSALKPADFFSVMKVFFYFLSNWEKIILHKEASLSTGKAFL